MNDERLPLAFFLKRDVADHFPAQADDIATKLDMWGRARNAEAGVNDTSRSTINQTIKTLRSSQQDFLTQSAEANLFKGSLIGQEDQIINSLRETGRKGYEPILDFARQGVDGRRMPTPDQAAAIEEIKTLLQDPMMLGYVDDATRIRAKKEGIDLEQLMQQDPIGAAHWLQSEFRRLADAAEDPLTGKGTRLSQAYDDLREMVVDPLKRAAPGYEGAMNRYGHEFGSKNAVRFGKGIFTTSRSAYETGQKVREFKRLSKRQQTVAWKSIKEEFLNEFRGTAEEAAAKVTRMQQEGALDLLEQLGARGQRFADDIRRIAQMENPNLRAIEQASGSPTHSNIRGAENAREIVQNPINKTVSALGNKGSWLNAAILDAVTLPVTHFPIATSAKIGSAAVSKFGNPSKKVLARATEGLYGLPPKNPAGNPTKGARAYGGRKVKGPTQPQAIEDLLKEFDDVESNKATRGGTQGKKLLGKIEAASKAQTPAKVKPKPPPKAPGDAGSASPDALAMIGGPVLGAAAGYSAAPDDKKAEGAAIGALGGAVVGYGAGRAMRGKKPPPMKGPPGAKGAPRPTGPLDPRLPPPPKERFLVASDGSRKSLGMVGPERTVSYTSPAGKQFRIEFRQDGDAMAVDFREKGASANYKPTGTGTLAEANAVLDAVKSAIRDDVAELGRPRYMFVGDTKQQQRIYQQMAKTTEAPTGYRWEGPDQAGAVYLQREDVALGREGGTAGIGGKSGATSLRAGPDGGQRISLFRTSQGDEFTANVYGHEDGSLSMHPNYPDDTMGELGNALQQAQNKPKSVLLSNPNAELKKLWAKDAKVVEGGPDWADGNVQNLTAEDHAQISNAVLSRFDGLVRSNPNAPRYTLELGNGIDLRDARLALKRLARDRDMVFAEAAGGEEISLLSRDYYDANRGRFNHMKVSYSEPSSLPIKPPPAKGPPLSSQGGTAYFTTPGGKRFAVDIDPNKSGSAGVHFAPKGDYGDLSLSEAKAVLNGVIDQVKQDIVTNARNEYRFVGNDAQKARIFQQLADRTPAPEGYRWETGQSSGGVSYPKLVREGPVANGFGGKSNSRSLLQDLARPGEPQRVADLLAGTPVSVTRDEAKEMLDIIRTHLRPEDPYEYGKGFGFTLDQLKADPSIAEHYLDYDPRKMAQFQAVLGTIPSQQGSSKLLAGIKDNPTGYGAASGAVIGSATARDQNGDGVVDPQERAMGALGGAVSLGIAGNVIGKGVRKFGGKPRPMGAPKGPSTMGFGGKPKGTPKAKVLPPDPRAGPPKKGKKGQAYRMGPEPIPEPPIPKSAKAVSLNAPKMSKSVAHWDAEEKAARRALTAAENKWVMKDDREKYVKPLEERLIHAQQMKARAATRDAQWQGIKTRTGEILNEPKITLKGAAVGTALVAPVAAGVWGAGELIKMAAGGEKKKDAPPNPRDPDFYWNEIVTKDEPSVKKVQGALADAGFWPDEQPITGTYGKYTKAAIKAWRASKGLDPDAAMTKADLKRLLAGKKGYEGDGGHWGKKGEWYYGDGSPVVVPQ